MHIRPLFLSLSVARSLARSCARVSLSPSLSLSLSRSLARAFNLTHEHKLHLSLSLSLALSRSRSRTQVAPTVDTITTSRVAPAARELPARAAAAENGGMGAPFGLSV
jgi:hypothetical protein